MVVHACNTRIQEAKEETLIRSTYQVTSQLILCQKTLLLREAPKAMSLVDSQNPYLLKIPNTPDTILRELSCIWPKNLLP